MREDFPEGVDRTWRYGRCYAMALALSERLGWPVGALTVKVIHDPYGRRTSDHVVHAWVEDPDGRFFDAGGFFDEAEVKAYFLENTARRFTDVRVSRFEDGAAFRVHLDSCFGHDPEWWEWSTKRFVDDVGMAGEAAEFGILDAANGAAAPAFG